MTEASKAFQDDIKTHESYYTMPKGIYIIYYNPASRKLVFEIIDTSYYFIIDENYTLSDDFKIITGIDRINNSNIFQDESNNIIRLEFPNVWDRENIYVQASARRY